MEQSTRLLMGWKVRTLEAYGLSFALIAASIDSIPLGVAGSSPTIALLFLKFLKASTLPRVWTMLGPSGAAELEVEVIASVVLASLICYPIAAFAGMRLITKGLSRRTLTALVSGAVALFCVGALVGLYVFARFVLLASAPYNVVGLLPVISGFDFYMFVLRSIVTSALVFTAPVYIVALVKRKRAGDRNPNR